MTSTVIAEFVFPIVLSALLGAPFLVLVRAKHPRSPLEFAVFILPFCVMNLLTYLEIGGSSLVSALFERAALVGAVFFYCLFRIFFYKDPRSKHFELIVLAVSVVLPLIVKLCIPDINR